MAGGFKRTFDGTLEAYTLQNEVSPGGSVAIAAQGTPAAPDVLFVSDAGNRKIRRVVLQSRPTGTLLDTDQRSLF